VSPMPPLDARRAACRRGPASPARAPLQEGVSPSTGRLRSSRGLKTVATGQRFFEGFEALYALHRGHIHVEHLVPDFAPADATAHEAPHSAVGPP
jgi:hypothetical protein